MFATLQIPHQSPVKVIRWEDAREFCHAHEWEVLRHTPEDIENTYGDDKPYDVMQLLMLNENHVVEIVRGYESEYLAESNLSENIYDELAEELVRDDMHVGFIFKSVDDIKWYLENGAMAHQGASVISKLVTLLEELEAEQRNQWLKSHVS